MCHEAGIFSAGSVLYSVPRVTSLATMTSTGRTTRTPLLAAIDRIRRASSTRSGSARLLPTALPCASRKVLAIPPPRIEQVHLGQQMVDDPDLVRDLGAAEDGRERSLRRLEQLRQHLELALHQEPGIGGQELGDPDGRGVRSMGRPERVVDEDVGVRRQGRGEGRVVRLLLGVEAQVLEHQDLARAEALDRVLRPDPERVAGDRHVAAQELGQPLPDRPQAQAVLDLAVRTAEVAGQDDRGAALQQGVDGRDGGPDPRVVGDLAVRQRDVEVDADEDAFAGDVDVADGELVHRSIRRRRAGAPRRTRSGRRCGSCSPIRCRTRR